MSNPPPLEPGKFYHLYNRGNNREHLLVEECNDSYFLQLYARHIETVAQPFCSSYHAHQTSPPFTRARWMKRRWRWVVIQPTSVQ